MPWCPNCRLEYVEGIKICPDCKTALVDSLKDAEEISHLEDELPCKYITQGNKVDSLSSSKGSQNEHIIFWDLLFIISKSVLL